MSPQGEQAETPLIVINGNIPGLIRQHKKKLILCAALLLLGIGMFVSSWGGAANVPQNPGQPKAATIPGDSPVNGTQMRQQLLAAQTRGERGESQLNLAEQRARELNGQSGGDQGADGSGSSQSSAQGSAQGSQANQAQGKTSTPAAAPQQQDGGFLVVSADGKNSAQPVMTQQQQELQDLIDKQKAFLKQSIENDPAATPATDHPAPHGPSVSVPTEKTTEKARYNEPAKLAVLPPTPGYYRISMGRTIPCILMNRIEGEYAGPVKCSVSVDYRSDDERRLLIPRGSIIVGEAGGVSSGQQKRISAGFHRLEIFQSDRSVISYDLDKFVGLDQAGATAIGGKVNNHMLSAMLWSLPLGGISALSMAGTNLGAGYNGTDAIRMGVAQSESQTAQQVIGRKTQAFPTITIREGTRIEVYVSQDIDLPEYKEQ